MQRYPAQPSGVWIFAGQDQRDRAAAERRERTLEGFLGAAPLPVGEWSDVEEELEALYDRGIGEGE